MYIDVLLCFHIVCVCVCVHSKGKVCYIMSLYNSQYIISYYILNYNNNNNNNNNERNLI